MPEQNEDLHGNAPDKSGVALLLIDVINDLEFSEGEILLHRALPVVDRLAKFKKRARAAKVPVVYVNDNFGRWRSDFRQQVEHCLNDGVRGRPLVERLRPEEEDYFVLKPKNSGFFATTLDILLRYLGAQSLILGGITVENCVLFTASDAYMRDYRLFVPSDAVVSMNDQEADRVLKQMETLLKAETKPTTELQIEHLAMSRPTRDT